MATTLNLDNVKNMRPVGQVSDSENQRLVSSLNTLLANEYAIFTKTLNYHWNVTGKRFHSMHEFLEKQYKDLLESIDELAERIRILGEHPISTVTEMKKLSDVEERPGKFPSTDRMLADLLRDHLSVQEQIKSVLDQDGIFKKDPGTEDFLISLLRKHEMMSWMLNSHLTNNQEDNV